MVVGPAAALDLVVPDLARRPHAAEPGARVSALEVLAHEVGGAVGVALALWSAWVAKVSELAGAERRVLVAGGGAVGVRAARVRVARVHAPPLLRVAAAGEESKLELCTVVGG